MQFGGLVFLWMLLLLPILVVFYLWGFRQKKILIEQFVSPSLQPRLLQNVSFTRQKFKAILMVLICLTTILSLIRPKWGFTWEEVTRKGVDIVVALDVSQSMLATDVSPNRLERAKREIIDLLNILQGDRVGLVAFAGTSFLQAPLTLDYGAVQIFLDDLSTDLIPIPGTAIGEAIETAIKSFNKEDKKSRVLILITDGEDTVGDPLSSAKKAAEEGVKIYTIGIGKEGGAPIPNPSGGGFKKDRNGEMVLTHLDEGTLKKISLETSGNYVRSITGDLDLEKIYEDINKNVQDKDLKSGRRQRFEERFQWPLLLAILLLFLEVFVQGRKPAAKTPGSAPFRSKLTSWLKIRRKKENFPSLSALFLLFCLGGLFPLDPCQAGLFGRTKAEEGEKAFQEGQYPKALENFIDAQIDSPSDFDLKYNLANTYYKMGRYEEAEKLFQSVAAQGDRQQAFKSLYNLGNLSYRQGKLQESVEFYKRALEIEPNDEDTKFNLKFVQDEIKRRLEQNKKRQEQQNQQNQQNKDQQKDPNQKDQQDQQDQNKKEDQQNQPDQKDQKKDSPQDSPKDQKSPQGEGKDKDKEKEKEKDEKEKDPKDQQGGSSPDSQQKSPQDQEKDQKEKEGEEAQAVSAKNSSDKEGEKMEKVEALRLLNSLEEDRKKFLKKRLGPSKEYSVEKDW